ncbi:hypothetical protein [Dactylosporangium matsuzakiense]|uniref:Uncharacterized protein n=1 Tax=Dactylosporangium matsuzakiense TaxID=53360 RepID=A0A9W6KGK4_9ACTN|nr:hypothetical protein [Dactylosporangium matsuzakiense]UWZ45638.1 hypothetical protein Dmats_03710 [Dactylosporangium matsuzakiense]GLL00349.1 hypothetical protein GCM10017581_020890 [Dactylosporangium matsuzakiense]
MRATALIVVPPLLVAVAAALMPGYVVFTLAALAIITLGHLLFGRRRGDEPPARPAWEFFAPADLLAARAGTAFATAVTWVGTIILSTESRIWSAFAVVVAALPVAVGVQLLVRLRRGGSVVRLTPSGVEVRGRMYPWERITTVELNGDRAVPRLDLFLTARRAPVQVRPEGIDASLLFLVDLLGYYQSHPRARGAIGTPPEAERVYGLLLNARLAAGLRGGPRPILIAS